MKAHEESKVTAALDHVYETEASGIAPVLAKMQVTSLEDLWGDFWPEDESVDDFIHAVRRWRREDLTLHKELQ